MLARAGSPLARRWLPLVAAHYLRQRALSRGVVAVVAVAAASLDLSPEEVARSLSLGLRSILPLRALVAGSLVARDAGQFGLHDRVAATRLECRLGARHFAAPLLTCWRPEMLVTLGCMTRMKVADSPLRASKLRESRGVAAARLGALARGASQGRWRSLAVARRSLAVR
jgi:hypothetical protein